jgi:hypothetical protein
VNNPILQRTSRGRKPRAARIYDASTVNGRLSIARAKLYPSARAAALANGWAVSTTGQHENGDKELSAHFAVKYARAYNVSLDYLFFGKAPMEFTACYEPLAQQTVSRLDLGDLNALLNFQIEKRAMSNRQIPITPHEGQPSNSRIFIRMDDSGMEKSGDPQCINAGDDLECDAAIVPQPSDIVLAIVRDKPRAIVRVYRIISTQPFRAELRPLNENFPITRIASEDDLRIIGKITRRITTL